MMILLLISVSVTLAATMPKTFCSKQSDCVPAFGSLRDSVCVHRNDDGATSESVLSLEYWVCKLVNVTKITDTDAVMRCGAAPTSDKVFSLAISTSGVKVSDGVVNEVGQVLLPTATVKSGAISLAWDQTVRECCSESDRVCDKSIVKLTLVSKEFVYQAAVLGQDCSHSDSEKPVTMVLLVRTAEKTSTAAAPTTLAPSASSTVAVPNDCICDRCCPPATACKTGCRHPKEPTLCAMYNSAATMIVVSPINLLTLILVLVTYLFVNF